MDRTLQQEVLEENVSIIPATIGRLQTAYEDLSMLCVSPLVWRWHCITKLCAQEENEENSMIKDNEVQSMGPRVIRCLRHESQVFLAAQEVVRAAEALEEVAA